MRNLKGLKIAVAGTCYVSLSVAILLVQNHKVIAVDIITEINYFSGVIRLFLKYQFLLMDV